MAEHPSHDKNEGKHRRRKVEKSCVAFLLYDPGWCVHKSDVQNKWDDNTRHTRSRNRSDARSEQSSTMISTKIISRQ